ncbi:MAG: penicillin-binding transpeptidase domain-containing protein, partial [Chitinophagaceae bacterium]
SNYDGRARGKVPMQEVLSQSLNTGVAFAVEKMGTNVFRTYLEKLGFSEETGIDLPNEATPLTENIKTSPRMIEYVTASYGQGIALTPLGMARSLSALASGIVPTPHIASEIVYGTGLSNAITWEGSQPVFKPKTNEDITRMLVEVVDTALLKGKAKQERYSIAAKTGTAQIADPNGGGYYADKYLHSFFGYFPAYDAKFLVFLYTVEPQGVSYASETLTNPFLDITKFLLSYYEIPPDR